MVVDGKIVVGLLTLTAMFLRAVTKERSHA
jgi:hypothetical protein